MLRAAERCVDRAPDAATLKKYEAFFDEGPPPLDVMRLLKGESYVGTATLRNLRAFGINDSNLDAMTGSSAPIHVDPDMLQRSGMPTHFRDRAYMSRHLEDWNAIFGKKSEAKNPRQLLMIAGRVMDATHGPNKPSYRLEQFLASVYGGLAGAMDRNDVSWQVTRALAMARIYKVQNGKYPSSLKEIGFKEIDPFSGKEFGYITDGQTVRIYSVGRDRIDNHGLRMEEVYRGSRREEMSAPKERQYDFAASDPPIAATKPLPPPKPPAPNWHPKSKAMVKAKR